MKFIFQIQNLYSKRSSRQLPCSIDNFAKILHENSGRNSIKSRKSEKKYFSKKKEFSSECSRGDVESSLDTPTGILLPHIKEMGPQMPKM